MADDDYTLDPAELKRLVDRMTRCAETLDELTDDVEGVVTRLQGTWHGEAAEAQRLAHLEWEKGLRAMREAIADLRDKGETAHGNYTAAVEANVAMWESVQ